MIRIWLIKSIHYSIKTLIKLRALNKESILEQMKLIIFAGLDRLISFHILTSTRIFSTAKSLFKLRLIHGTKKSILMEWQTVCNSNQILLMIILLSTTINSKETFSTSMIANLILEIQVQMLKFMLSSTKKTQLTIPIKSLKKVHLVLWALDLHSTLTMSLLSKDAQIAKQIG